VADLGNVTREINAMPAELRPMLLRIFQAILKDLRFGHPGGEQPDPCMNFGAGFFHGTTPSVALTEFSIAHGFGRTPYLAMPVLRLDTVGSRTVPLEVTRDADDKRIYLKSTIASAPVSLIVEG
jgi:hypothetical protein